MRRLFVLAIICALAVIACSESAKPQFKAIDITGADYAKDFQLTDQFGVRRSMQNFAGKVVVLFFGYTQCPDVCPTTMAELAQAKKLLGAQGEKVQGIFITVDPQRDSSAVLKAYMDNFDAHFLAFSPTQEQLAILAKDFKIYYKKVPGPSPTSYTMDHSAGSYVYDTHGRVRLFTRYGSGAQALADDLKILLRD